MVKKFGKQSFLKRAVILAIVSGCVLFIFYAFSFLVKGGRLHNFDFDMTVHLSDKTPKKFDPYFSILSLTGSFEVTIVILTALIFLRRKLSAFLVVGVFCLAHLVELFGKSFLNHPPPPFMFFRYTLGFEFPTSYIRTGNSYPSGHAMRMIFLFIVGVWILFGLKKMKIELKYVIFAGAIAYTALMLLSRVVLGEHWASDVIGGSILGASFGTLSLMFL